MEESKAAVIDRKENNFRKINLLDLRNFVPVPDALPALYGMF